MKIIDVIVSAYPFILFLLMVLLLRIVRRPAKANP